MRYISKPVYIFAELNKDAQTKAIDDHVQYLLDIREDDFVERAIKEADRMQTPWFVGSYVFEYGKEEIMQAVNSAEYFENGEFYGWIEKMTFYELLKCGKEMDCELIVGDVEMPASLVWDGKLYITKYGYEKFKPLMDAECVILENGNVEIFCDDYKLGENFCLSAAGYCAAVEYDNIFKEQSEIIEIKE